AAQHRRDADHHRPRGAHRRPLRDAPVLHVRQGHDGLRVRGLRHAGLLAGAPAHDPVRRPARLAADLGPALAQLGVSVVLAPAGGLREPPRAADHRRDLRRARRLLALHAPVHARGHPARLRAVGARQGARRAGRDRQARAAERDAADRDGARPVAAGAHRRQRDRGVHLRDPGDGPAHGPGGVRARLSGDHGQPRHRRDAHARRQPPRRRHLRPRRSADPRGRAAGTALRAFWRALRRNRLALVGGLIVVLLALLAILAPALAPWDPNRPDVRKILDAPSGIHPLGTDQLGRDVLSRMLYGARVSLAVGFVSVGIASLIGTMLGAAAGYHGGVVDATLMRLVDLMLVFPRFFLLLAVLAFLRPSIWTIMAVIGLTGWMGVARLVRAEFLALKEREFVVWSQAVGASGLRIVWRHILPNAMAPVLVAMTLGIPAAILTESGLSFLGLGVQPPHATWGNILNEGKDAIEIGWWLSVYPGLAILLTVLSYNLLGEGIRDALDPRLRQSAARFVSRAR